MSLSITEESFRDGPQSLWANRLRTRDMLPAARHAANAGVGRINLLSGVGFEVAVSFLQENPMDRFRLLRKLTTGTPSTILVRGRNLFGWTRYSDDVVTYCLEQLAELGLDEFEVFDALNDTRNIEHHVREGIRLGMRVSSVISFSESHIHTNDHFAQKAKDLASFGTSAIFLGDATGVMKPERVKPLIAAIRAAAPGIPIEMTVHDQTGLALACYREAMEVGVVALSSAARSVAGANSVPATADVIALAHELGVSVDVDEGEVAWLDSYFRYVAHVYGKPLRHDVHFDEAQHQKYAGHQIPGGMMSHYVSQLEGLGLLDRLPEVLDEAARVRVELGCPVMVTPFSQLVGVQAMFNVLDGKRYHTVPADLKMYARGHFGEPPGPIDPWVLDRISDGEAPIDSTEVFGAEMLPEIMAQMPGRPTVDDVFLQLFSVPDKVAAMRRNSADTIPLKRLTPLGALVGQLAVRSDITALDITIDRN